MPTLLRSPPEKNAAYTARKTAELAESTGATAAAPRTRRGWLDRWGHGTLGSNYLCQCRGRLGPFQQADNFGRR